MTFLLSLPPSDEARVIAAGPVLRAGDRQRFNEAVALLEAARNEAASIVAAARQAYEGQRRRGYEDGKAEWEAARAQWLLRQRDETVAYLEAVEGQIVDVVMGSVRRIMASYDDDERALIVVRSALDAVRQQKQVTVRLHPRDAEMVRTRLEALMAGYPAMDYIDVVDQEDIARGTCRLETEIGTVQTGIDAQIAALRESFERGFARRRASAKPADAEQSGGQENDDV